MRTLLAITAASLALSGCVTLEFNEAADGRAEGVLFYDPIPHLVVTRNKDCSVTAVLMNLPDTSRPRSVHVTNGLWGSAEVSFNNAMIASLSGENSVDVPALLAAAGVSSAELIASDCGAPEIRLYRIGSDQSGVRLTLVGLPTNLGG